MIVEEYESLASQAANANPIALLRKWMTEAGLTCERLHPVDAGATLVLVATATLAPARRPRDGDGQHGICDGCEHGTGRPGVGRVQAATAGLVSFEFFPPNDAEMEATLWASIQRLAPLAPRFVSVTYGADGSTRERTHNVVTRILRRDAADPGAAPDLRRCAARRDPRRRARLLGRRRAPHRRAARRRTGGPGGRTRRTRTALRTPSTSCAGCRTSATSTSRSRRIRRCTPRRRARSSTSTTCKRQDRRGRQPRDHAVLLRHRHVPALSRPVRRARASDAQIVPGILPITRFPQMLRFAQRCGASVPDWLAQRFDGLDDDPETRRLIAANCRDRAGAPPAGARRRTSSISTR